MRPCGHRVLVRPKKVEEKSEGGIILHSQESAKKMEQTGNVKGTIVAIGPTAWKAFDRAIVRQTDGSDKVVHGQPWANVGDKVIYSKYGGTFVPDPDNKNEHLVMLNDEDIVAILDEEEL